MFATTTTKTVDTYTYMYIQIKIEHLVIDVIDTNKQKGINNRKANHLATAKNATHAMPRHFIEKIETLALNGHPPHVFYNQVIIN